MRRVYLEHLLAWEAGDEMGPPPDPFDPVGAKELLEWLNSVALSRVGPSRLTVYQATLYAHQPELHADFPDPQGADYDRFQNWLARQAEAGKVDPLLVPGHHPDAGAATVGGALDLVGDRLDSTSVWAASEELASGMTVVGYLDKHHSIGELGRLAIAGVQAAGIPFQPVAVEFG